MADELPKVGARAVVENVGAYEQMMNRVILPMDTLTRAQTAQSNALRSGGRAAQESARALNRLSRFFQVTAVQGRVTAARMVEAANSITQISVAVAGAAAAIVGFYKLTARGGEVEGIRQNFLALAQGIEGGPTQALNTLREAARGTVSDFELMQTTNRALFSTFGEFRTEFGEALPDLLAFARLSARATGQDVGFLFDSLVRGIKRGRPLLIDNAELIINLTETYKKYADSIHKNVDALSQEDKQLAVLQATREAAAKAVAEAQNVSELSTEKMARIGARLSNIIDRISIAIQPAANLILDIIDNVIGGFEILANKILPVVQVVLSGVANFVRGLWETIKPAIEPIFGLIGSILRAVENVAGQMLLAGATLLGEFVNGLLWAANNLLLPVVEAIAQTIADFLIGSSPPPRGPLHEIAEGGKAVIEAWLEGMLGAGIEPVETVAAQVRDAMGVIADFSRQQVEKAFARLDAALQPFQDRLDILKSKFEALMEPADAALGLLDKQLTRAVQSLLAGEKGSDAVVRSLDMQIDRIRAAIISQEDLVAAEEIRVGLVKASQAEERALLTIRKRQLGDAEKTKKVIEKTGKKAKEAKGDIAAMTDELGGGGAIDFSAFEDIPGLDTSFLKQLEENFQGPLTGPGGQLKEFETRNARISGLFDSIKNADLGSALTSRITEAFNSIAGMFDITNPDSLASKINFFFNGEGEGSFRGALANIGNFISEFVLNPLQTISDMFNPGVPDTLGFFITDFSGTQIPGLTKGLSDVSTGTTNWWTVLIGTVGTLALLNIVSAAIPGILAGARIGMFLFGIAGSIVSVIYGGVNVVLTTLNGLLGIAGIIKSLGLAGIAAIASVAPFIILATAILAVVAAIAELNNLLNIYNESGSAAAQALSDEYAASQISRDIVFDQTIRAVRAQMPGAPAFIQDLIARSVYGELEKQGLFQVDYSTYHPAIQGVGVPGGATGGIFGSGAAMVGERGPELIAPATRFSVFPNDFIQGISALTNVMQQVVAAPMYPGGGMGGGTTNTTTTNIVVNGRDNPRDTARAIAMEMAWSRP